VTGRFDVTTHEWQANAAADKTWAIFQMHFKAAYSDSMLVEMTGTSGHHGSANLTTTLATTHSALIASELDLALALALALQANATPSIITSVASTTYLSAITPGTEAPSACTYYWTHGITASLTHTSATCNSKCNSYQDAAPEENTMGWAKFT
jgi:hypothetical protein